MEFLKQYLSETDFFIINNIFFKVIVATIVGAIIGVSREKKGKSAGIKTHILLCVGATVFTSSSFFFGDSRVVDHSRIVAQIIPGIGFIGAGTIFRAENKVYGLTSAALIWVVTALGVIVGLGGYFSGIALAACCVILTSTINKLEMKYFPNGNNGKSQSCSDGDSCK